MKLSALRAVLFDGQFPSLGGVAAEPPGWFVAPSHSVWGGYSQQA